MSDLITKINKLNVKKIDFFQFIRFIYHISYISDRPVTVKFLASYNLSYVKSEIEKIKVLQDEEGNVVVQVTTAFFNIAGNTGVLPSHYTQLIINNSKNRDFTLLNFTNIFYDKIIKSFIQIVTRNNLLLEMQSSSLGADDIKSSRLYRINHLVGILPDVVGKDFPKFLLHYAGLLINSSRSAYVLKALLSHYYRLKVEIRQFIEEKIGLREEEATKLGQNNCCLGESLYLGTNAYFNLNKIEICFYDISYNIYEKFLEDKNFIKIIHQILSFYLDKHIGYILTFLVKEHEKVTFLTISKPRKLGLNIWCKV